MTERTPDMTSTTGRPQPVLTEATLAAVVSNVAAIATAFGFINTAEGGEITTAAVGVYAAVAAALSVASHLVAAVRARRQVTPTSAPQTDSGVPLVPAGTGGTLHEGQYPAA